MNRRLPPGALLILLLAAPGTARPEAPEEPVFSRRLEVARPGWVRVPLDAHARGRGPLRILAPSGATVEHDVLRQAGGEVAASTLSVREEPSGWELIFDLGPAPVRHEAFDVEIDRPTVAAGCRLEGAPEPGAWKELGSADLFRVGSKTGLGRWRLAYPPTDARFLRLHWPARAGFPELRRAVVVPSPGLRPRAVAGLEIAPDETLGRGWRLALPAPGLEVEEVRIRPTGRPPLGYRLYGAEEGRWEVLAEGEIDEPGEVGLELHRGRVPGAVLRLELFGEGDPPPGLEKAEALLPPVWLLFRASEAGSHRLAYGAAAAAGTPAPDGTPPEAVGSVQEVAPGPLEETAPPPLHERLTAPREPARRLTAVEEWSVVSGAATGAVARLSLPSSVLESFGEDPGALRILAGEREVPFVRLAPVEPVLLTRSNGAVPGPGEAAMTSRVALDLGGEGRRAAQLEMLAPAVPFDRTLTIRAVRDARPGVEGREVILSAEWRCPGASTLPCRYAPGLDGLEGARLLEVVFDDREGPPLPALDMLLWGREETLAFVWPRAGEELRLVRMYEAGGPPRYELEGFRGSLLLQPWVEARLDLDRWSAAGAGRERRGRLLLVGSLIVAGGILVWLLGRLLRPAAPR